MKFSERGAAITRRWILLPILAALLLATGTDYCLARLVPPVQAPIYRNGGSDEFPNTVIQDPEPRCVAESETPPEYRDAPQQIGVSSKEEPPGIWLRRWWCLWSPFLR